MTKIISVSPNYESVHNYKIINIKMAEIISVSPDSGGVHCGAQEPPWSMVIPLINQQKK